MAPCEEVLSARVGQLEDISCVQLLELTTRGCVDTAWFLQSPATEDASAGRPLHGRRRT
jgi:hypothetical protein